MIFKLKFLEKEEYAQAKSQLHLLQEYHKEYDDFLEIQEVIEISDEEAKTIMLNNLDYNEETHEQDDMPEFIALFDLVAGNDFVIVGTNELI